MGRSRPRHGQVANARAKCHGSRVNDTSFPVTVLVQRPDGSSESVRVGTAVRTDDGFRLTLGELSIGATPVSAAPYSSPRAAPTGARGDGMVFPPYGRSKGAPISGATTSDLEFYIQGSRRSLDDPSKARFHDKERVLLAAMEAELAKQGRGGAPSPSRSSSGSSPSRSGGGSTDGREEFGSFDEPSPFAEDDDIPF